LDANPGGPAFVAATLALSAINKFPVKWALVWQVEHNGEAQRGAAQQPSNPAAHAAQEVAACKVSKLCRSGL